MMDANFLNSERAVEMRLCVIRAFVKMRAELNSTADLTRRLAEIERTLIGYESALRELYNKIRPLLFPPSEPTRREIGFHTRPGDCQARGRRK